MTIIVCWFGLLFYYNLGGAFRIVSMEHRRILFNGVVYEFNVHMRACGML